MGEKKNTHNAIERRYRSSINDKIIELKNMIIGTEAKNANAKLKQENMALKMAAQKHHMEDLMEHKPHVTSTTSSSPPLREFTPPNSDIGSPTGSFSDLPDSPPQPITFGGGKLATPKSLSKEEDFVTRGMLDRSRIALCIVVLGILVFNPISLLSPGQMGTYAAESGVGGHVGRTILSIWDFTPQGHVTNTSTVEGLTLALSAVNLAEACLPSPHARVEIWVMAALRIKESMHRSFLFLARYFLNKARKEKDHPQALRWLMHPYGTEFFLSKSWSYTPEETLFSTLDNPGDPLSYMSQNFREYLLERSILTLITPGLAFTSPPNKKKHPFPGTVLAAYSARRASQHQDATECLRLCDRGSALLRDSLNYDMHQQTPDIIQVLLYEAVVRLMAGVNPLKIQQLLEESMKPPSGGPTSLLCSGGPGTPQEGLGVREQAEAMLLACQHLPDHLVSCPGERRGLLTEAARILERLGHKPGFQTCQRLMLTLLVSTTPASQSPT
ncbi:SREBF1 [Cordylochernes scorpioides]|uniref:SREBF1 n=1 Tax=Cordylochernes scorpioides TaxID=51811 RepID=A0ABY6LUC0_9ARAC|nr:SREBF1 [Cordylochernes scorpioides]